MTRPLLRLVQITAPHFVAGSILLDDSAYRVAPIIRYMRGWSYAMMIYYASRKGWRITTVNREDDAT